MQATFFFLSRNILTHVMLRLCIDLKCKNIISFHQLSQYLLIGPLEFGCMYNMNPQMKHNYLHNQQTIISDVLYISFIPGLC